MRVCSVARAEIKTLPTCRHKKRISRVTSLTNSELNSEPNLRAEGEEHYPMVGVRIQLPFTFLPAAKPRRSMDDKPPPFVRPCHLCHGGHLEAREAWEHR